MAVTMNEIARALGVSVATVSRVLSGSEDNVSEEARAAILGAAAELGYRPRRKIGRTVAFLIDNDLFNLSSLFYTNVISGVEKEVALRRFFFQFITVKPADTPVSRLNLKFNDLAGVVLIDTYEPQFARRLRTLGIPVVLVDCWVPTEDIDSILIDNVDGIMRAGRHLQGLGHARVSYLSGSIDSGSANERRYGFQQARDAYGLDPDLALVEECPECISGGFDAMNRVLDRTGRRPPTAVIAYNDLVAIGAMDAIKQRGLSIPHDISIVGFDDLTLAAEVIPPLTTMQVPKELMGRMAAEIIFSGGREQRRAPHKILLPARLVERATTAPPRKG
jgi:DNA-binding LacI/PurR family transcriptional regulator